MKQKLSDIPKQTPQFWVSLGNLLVNEIRKRVRNKHLNYKNQKFKDYESSYAALKGSGRGAPKGQSQSSSSTIPDMTLTGKTMNDLQVREWSKNFVVIGWAGVQGGIVEFLHDMKNYMIVGLVGKKVLSDKEEKIIVDSLGDDMQKKIDKYHNEPININIEIEF